LNIANLTLKIENYHFSRFPQIHFIFRFTFYPIA
jgi:hypothetical protein